MSIAEGAATTEQDVTAGSTLATLDRRRIPAATYRLQLREAFGFAEASAIADYLAALGVSHVYTSPYLQAAPGSTHGYDVVDPTRVSEDLGGEEARREFVATLGAAGLGQVVDIVPNHLGLTTHLGADGPGNRWWWDVLRRGRSSPFATYFDVDWEPPATELSGKVLLPILGAAIADEVSAGTLRLEPGAGGGDEWVVAYADDRFPLAPETVPPAGEAPTGDALIDVLARQHYHLAQWQAGLSRLNYRRFFDVSQLVALRMEEPEVFRRVHQLPLRWVADGEVDGLRVDHPDGLADPVGYTRELRESAPGAWICVEKILVGDEELDEEWPVDGTTGYDALRTLTELLVDPAGEPAITQVFSSVTGSTRTFPEVTRATRVQVMRELLVPEVRRVALALRRVAERRDLPGGVSDAVAAVEAFLSEMPVYRTYAWPGRAISADDAAVVSHARQRALEHHDDILAELVELLAAVITDTSWQARDDDAAELARLTQQLSGPVMAKGVEDTAFYRYTRFVALNEVGGEPDRFGADLESFHAAARRRAARRPASMVTTSTHDTKRSEDVRARLAVLSEMADEWAETLRHWSARGADLWPGGPPRNHELEILLHQTLLGAHPLEPERVHAYLDKAMREAKSSTSWLEPDPVFERAAHQFVDHLLADPAYTGELDAWYQRVLVPGRVNSLTQKLVALTMPGVPDLYQGSELWNLDLVDPDNRKPVDYSLRRQVIAAVRDGFEPTAWRASLADPHDVGLTKMAVVRAALDVRAQHPACFAGAQASYAPLGTTDAATRFLVAYTRGDAVVVAAPRLGVRREREGGWGNSTLELPPGRWRNVFTGVEHDAGSHPVTAILADVPVALMVRR